MILLLSALAPVACANGDNKRDDGGVDSGLAEGTTGSTADGSDDSDTWAGTSPQSTSSTSGGGPADSGADTEGDEPGDDGGSGGEGTIYVVGLGEATVMAGASFDGWEVAAVVEVFADESEVDHCFLFWAASSSTPATDCTDCEFAFDVQYSEVEVDVDVDGACAEHGIVAADFEGVQIGLGYRNGEVMVRDDDGTWAAAGEATFDAQMSLLSYEWDEL
jgi:hypothetical protein